MEPGQSPVLKTKNRTYMFPDVTVEQVDYKVDTLLSYMLKA